MRFENTEIHNELTWLAEFIIDHHCQSDECGKDGEYEGDLLAGLHWPGTRYSALEAFTIKWLDNSLGKNC